MPGVPMPTPRMRRLVASAKADREVGDHREVVAADEGDLLAGEDVAVEVDDAAGELAVGGQVEGDRDGRVLRDADEGRGLAHVGAGAGAELADEAFVDQLGDEVGDRDPGQRRLAGEVGTASRTVVDELLEDQRAVVPAGVGRAYLADGSAAGGAARSGLIDLGHIVNKAY